jgi:hypothetical protein
MTVELSLRPDSKVILVCFHTMYTPENCSDTGVMQHYWLKPYQGKCMCGEVDWEKVRIEIDRLLQEK